MAQVIWKGEAELCRENELPPAHTTWGKYKFPVGQPVEVTEPWLIAKARANKFFEVVDKPFFIVRGPVNTGDIIPPSNVLAEAVDSSMNIEVPPKRKSGWPKGKPRKPRAEQQVTDGTDNQLRDAD